MRSFRAERGLSLVEVTIILMVLSILAAAIAPSARAFIEDGRSVKAKKDLETIGSAIEHLMRDTGMRCLSFNGLSCANDASGRVELLVSGLVVNTNEPTVVTTAAVVAASTASAANLNWAGGASEVADARRDLMDDQLVTNAPSYTATSFTSGGGPRAGIGWRGAYATGPIDLDPWGYVYQASTVFLSVASDAADGTGAGQRRGGWTNDVIVVSAGSNGTVQTTFGGVATNGAGDDVVYVLSGGTR